MKFFLVLITFFSISLFASAQNIDFDAVQIEFTSDTAHVEQEVRDMLDKDYTTMGMIEAAYFSEQEYDKLLNKYYKFLYNVLNDEGKKALQATQRNWIKLRDSDKELVRAMQGQVYEDMGGGTVWGIIAANSRADITRRRVIELFNYSQFTDLGGR